jgi:putative transposase
MTRALSMDLRERAMARLEKGESVRQVSTALRVANSSVVKWSQLKRETGSCAPRKATVFRPCVLKEKDRAYIRMRLKAEAHATLRTIQAELAERGTRVGYGTIWNFVHADGLSFKKNRHRG